MTAYPAWTPASRPGIIPLHPLTFGTILGRSFAALRQNPRVLLGFALCVQAVAYLLVILAVGGVAIASFTRLDTLQPGTDDYQAVMAGSIAVTIVVGVVMGLAAVAFGVIVQGVVVTEVAHAAVAEKLTLRALWQQVKPVTGRLVGYAFLVLLALVAAFGVAGVLLFGLGAVALPAAVGLGVLAFLAAIPLVWWLMVKLLLVPSAIILERATIGQAIGRSWRLTRGRFWPILGVLVLLNLIFAGIAQVVSIPFSFLSAAGSTIIAPTGDPQVGGIIAIIATGLLSQAVVLLIQAVAVIVQSTATALFYIDCRMRHEGLDLDLLAYVEKRDAGATGLADPYREHIGRRIGPRQAAPSYPPGYAPPAPGYAAPPPSYAAPPTAGPATASPAAYAPTPPAPYPTTPPYAQRPTAADPAARPADPPTQWAAPETPREADPDSPWS